MSDEVTPKPEVKPGYKTSEFWLNTVVILLNLVVSSGAVVETSTVGKIVFGALSVLAALGYTAARKAAKAG